MPPDCGAKVWTRDAVAAVDDDRIGTTPNRPCGCGLWCLACGAACVVSDAHDLSPALESMYRAMGQEVPIAKRILELNPDHLLVQGLNRAYQEREDRSGLAETAELLHGLAVLAEGGRPKEPGRFVKLVAERLERVLR